MITDINNIKTICERVVSVIEKKNADYGGAFAKMYEKKGISYAVGKIDEKALRIDTLSENKNMVEGESFKDALEDEIGYCLLTLDMIEQAERYSS